jgi:hypothetical protein
MRGERESSSPPELPEELATFLQGQDLAAVTTETDQGTALVVMAPAAELAAMGGAIPIGIRHELYRQPSAPVIRMVTAFYDRPDEPLAFETFFNAGDPQQRREYELLATQRELPILFYDQDLTYVRGKRVAIRNGAEIAAILRAADELRAAIPAEQFDFDRAKQEVMAAVDFPELPYR